MTDTMNNITYVIEDALYLNITNRCNLHCDFCLRYITDKVGEKRLWLDSEPPITEIIEAIKKEDISKYKEVIFCGYGEPLLEPELVVETAKFIKSLPHPQFPKGIPVRINTNGLANFGFKRNVLPELKGWIDKLSISLNAESEEKYIALTHPDQEKGVYAALLEFIVESKKYIPEVVASVVELPSGNPNAPDIEKCQAICNELGVPLKIREYLENNYEHHRTQIVE